jgi:NADPH:quinone reductase-like Zn-dependent oxidoreductase
MQQNKIYEGKGVDSIKLEHVDKPTLKEGTDVLVRIHALSLNARDPQFATGSYALPMPKDGTVVTSGKSLYW